MCRLPASSILLLLSLASPIHATSSPQAAMRHLHGRFAISLYRALTAGRPEGNLVVSPAGVAASLGLLQLGAKGATLAQLEGSLGYNVNDAQVRDLLLQSQAETSNNSSRGAAGLRKTCVLLVQSGVKLVDRFTQNAAAWADASVVRGNFSQPDGGLGHDEAWPLQSGSSSGELSGSGEAQQGAEAMAWWGHGLQMALVNTVAFRGVWQKQFHFSNTQNLPFVLSDGTPIKVPMMYQTTEVSFGQFRTPSEQRYTVLELPYLGRSLSLQVVLPSERKTPLSSLEAQLSVRHMASWDVGLRRTKMDVFLPRFKMHNKFNLRSTLPVMGVGDVFNPTAADFSGISAEESLYVSDAFHDVTIEVTEEGTKAAAATAMVLLKRSRAPVFKADRPFLFLLRHVQSGSILFMGRVTNPAEQSL
uniref:probable serpin E3 n=1 Tax=Doryrhamphus excisus TaxID=161450 RepID=UPI0025AE27D5|nr:probable serpin E3 [Doryrhamphus excisus]